MSGQPINALRDALADYTRSCERNPRFEYDHVPWVARHVIESARALLAEAPEQPTRPSLPPEVGEPVAWSDRLQAWLLQPGAAIGGWQWMDPGDEWRGWISSVEWRPDPHLSGCSLLWRPAPVGVEDGEQDQ